MKLFNRSEKNWLAETIEFFRTLGFFERQKLVSTAELAGIINGWFEQKWGK